MKTHSHEAEQQVLGSILVNPACIDSVVQLLRQDSGVFHAPPHVAIYDTILELHDEAKPIDVVTLGGRLEATGRLESAGGPTYLSELLSVVTTSANVEAHCRDVLDHWVRRSAVEASDYISRTATDGNVKVDELLAESEKAIFALSQARQTRPSYKMADIVDDAAQSILDIIDGKRDHHGIRTGYPSVDGILSGLKPSDMAVLAARTSVGKTALALNLTYNICKQYSGKVLFFSLEMSKEQLAQRLLCIAGKVDMVRIQSGFCMGSERPKVEAARSAVRDMDLIIDDDASPSILDVRSKARQALASGPVSLVVIDYIQLMQTGHRRESRQVEVSEISRQIKAMARELAVPVLALAQLNRQADTPDGMPRLSQLRESGAIEQDADIVILLSRKGADNENVINVDIAKQRNGPTGVAELVFYRNIQVFDDPKELAPAAPPEAYDVDAFDEFDDVPF